MNKVIIITSSFLNIETKSITVGGLQKYIQDLANLCVEAGYETKVYQIVPQSTEDYELKHNGYIVRFASSNKNKRVKYNQDIFDCIYRNENTRHSLFIIATDCLDIKTMNHNVVNIQHGISFDNSGYDTNKANSKLWRIKHQLGKLYSCYLNVKRFYNVNKTICVDYNFFNWIRTIATIYPETTVRIIPNYSDTFISENNLYEKINNRSKKRKLIFARRFYDYRGTLLFADVAKRLLEEFDNIEISFAGDGPLRNKLEELFSNDSRVNIFSYSAVDSVEIHKEYDIAIIPTIYSEGTSLALCESMAAGCLPIATHVGGMTNIILDGYNGFLAYPNIDSVYNACRKCLMLETEEFNRICVNAYFSVLNSFSYRKWSMSWLEFLKETFQTNQE